MIPAVHTAARRLLALPDTHRALLAEYDFFPQHSLLYVHWHGHLTAPTIVQGAQAGLDLFKDGQLPRRILTHHGQASGEWEEAIPWLHYEWLPQAVERGVELLSHVISADSSTRLGSESGGAEFIEELRKQLNVRSFRSPAAAWQWAITR